MRKITLAELRRMAINSKVDIWEKAQSLSRDVKLYLHWTAGRYDQKFDDYHINIDGNGDIWCSTEDLSEVLAHTWKRNTGAIGIGLCACYNAQTTNLGDFAPTKKQIEVMAQVIAALCKALDLSVDKYRVLTHAEAADNVDELNVHEDYGPATTCERWDLAILQNGDAWMSGGDTLRGKAIWYQINGVA